MRKILVMLRKMLDRGSVIWIFGGGIGTALLMLALFGWRAAVGTFAVWMITVIAAVVWALIPDNPAKEEK